MLECDMNDDGAVTCAEAIRVVYADHEFTGEARVRWDANATKWTDAKMHVTHARRGSVEFLQEELSKKRVSKAQLSAALDPNGNGNVSFKEWREGLRALGIHLGVEQYKVVNGAQNVGANSAHTTCGVWRRDAVRMANPRFWRRPNCAELRRVGLPRSTRRPTGFPLVHACLFRHSCSSAT